MNKKGALQWPTVLLSTVFSLVLLIIGIVMISNITHSLQVSNIKVESGLDFYIFSARIMNSPDCAAWEDAFSSNDRYVYQPHLGIIDAAKFNQDKIQKCLSGKKFSLILNYNKKISSIANINDASELNNAFADAFNVRVYDSGRFYDGTLEMIIK